MPADADRNRDLAQRFHEAYERLAPSFGYETRAETREFDPNSPNGKLMIAVCQEIAAGLEAASPSRGDVLAVLDNERGALLAAGQTNFACAINHAMHKIDALFSAPAAQPRPAEEEKPERPPMLLAKFRDPIGWKWCVWDGYYWCWLPEGDGERSESISEVDCERSDPAALALYDADVSGAALAEKERPKGWREKRGVPVVGGVEDIAGELHKFDVGNAPAHEQTIRDTRPMTEDDIKHLSEKPLRRPVVPSVPDSAEVERLKPDEPKSAAYRQDELMPPLYVALQLLEGSKANIPDADREIRKAVIAADKTLADFASVTAKRDALRQRVGELEAEHDSLKARAHFAEIGDNHHNAAACPYCGDLLGKANQRIAEVTDRLDWVESDRENVARMKMALQSRVIDLESQLAAAKREPWQVQQQAYAAIASEVRDISRRIGPAAAWDRVRSELDALAHKYEP